jgi:hypothetical protein
MAENYKKTFAERLTSLLADTNEDTSSFVPINFFSTIDGGKKQYSLAPQSSMTAFDHLYTHAAYLTFKNQKIKASREAHIDTDCTFKPEILSKASGGSSQ